MQLSQNPFASATPLLSVSTLLPHGWYSLVLQKAMQDTLRLLHEHILIAHSKQVQFKQWT